MQDYDFENASTVIGTLLPPELTGTEIFRGAYGSDALAKAALLAGINGGPLLVNYTGHGSVEIWRGSVLTIYDAPALSNGTSLPFFINMTCLNGAFHDLFTEGLSEALLKAAGGGAVAVWSSSGLTEPEGQHLMNRSIIELLFNGEGLTMGEAAARAKAAVTDPDVRKTWIFLGDPTTRLRYQVATD